MNRLRYFLKTPLRPVSLKPPVFRDKPTRVTKGGLNFHKSNRAREGLYHGKDVQFGHSISHSHTKSKRKWKPNVQNKRVWSDALSDWVRFKITTTALRAVDNVGGIDNYILSLDEKLVQDSNYITKVRNLIASTLFHKGSLNPFIASRLGYSRKVIPPAEPVK